MRILLIEDEKRIARFIKQGLEEENYRVEVAEDGLTGLETIAQTSYDLVLLDVMLPDLTGFEVCQIMRQRGLITPVLMLTARDEVDDKVKGLDSGADDYLPKPFAFKELLARIRALTRRTAPSTPPTDILLQFADLTLNLVTRQIIRKQEEIVLTSKEFTLLEYFLRHPRRPLSRTTIQEAVWGYDYFGGSNIVDVYVRRLRRKLEKDDHSPLIHTVRGVGYKLDTQ